MNGPAIASSPLTADEQGLLWRQLFQHTPGALFGLEAVRDEQTKAVVDFRYRFINEAALRDVFLQQPERQHDITGQLFSTYFPSFRQSPLWDLYQEVMETQQARQSEGSYLFDGHSLRVQMAVSPFNDGILLSYNEVSQQHRSAQALQRQSVRLASLLNSSPNAVVVFDAVRDAGGQPVDFQVNTVNQLFAELLGQPPESFAGVSIHALYPLKPHQMAQLIHLMDTGEPIRREEYAAAHDRWLDLLLSRTDEGFVAILRDITAEKASLRQIEQQAQLLNGLMNTVQNGISVLDAVRNGTGRLVDYRFVDVSQSLLAGLGLTRERVVGQRILSILPGMSKTTLWPIYLRVLETGVPHQFEHHYNTDGFDRYFDLSVAKLNDGLVVSYTNISDTKRAQLQLETLVLELRRSNESLNQFAYVASHDLQEPLRKIVSFGDVLQQQYAGELSESAADLVQRMQSAAGRMRILMQDLLTYSRLTGNPALHEPVRLDQVLTHALAILEDTVLERQAELTLTPLPIVLGDSRLLLQLFHNILSNSLKFCRPGQVPRIVITGQTVQSPEALPTAGRCAEITITDEGIGFDEKYLDRIFTVFQRLHGQQQYTGTGIGLAIAKKVVELHSGAITARSQPGAGSTFTIWLPAV